MRSLLLVESLDFRPSNQYILVSDSPSCLRLAKMCVCQVRQRSRWSSRYLTLFSWGICTSFIWTGGHVSLLVVNVPWTYLVSSAFVVERCPIHIRAARCPGHDYRQKNVTAREEQCFLCSPCRSIISRKNLLLVNQWRVGWWVRELLLLSLHDLAVRNW
jgi:hypothetical protein